MVEDAFKTATSAGGRYYGMNEKLANSAGGKFSTMMGRFKNSLSKIGLVLAELIKPLFDITTAIIL